MGVGEPVDGVAVEQLEHAVKKLGFKGVGVAGSVDGLELADRKFDPFWAKCEELDVVVLAPHPYTGWEAMDNKRSILLHLRVYELKGELPWLKLPPLCACRMN